MIRSATIFVLLGLQIACGSSMETPTTLPVEASPVAYDLANPVIDSDDAVADAMLLLFLTADDAQKRPLVGRRCEPNPSPQRRRL